MTPAETTYLNRVVGIQRFPVPTHLFEFVFFFEQGVLIENCIYLLLLHPPAERRDQRADKQHVLPERGRPLPAVLCSEWREVRQVKDEEEQSRERLRTRRVNVWSFSDRQCLRMDSSQRRERTHAASVPAYRTPPAK